MSVEGCLKGITFLQACLVPTELQILSSLLPSLTLCPECLVGAWTSTQARAWCLLCAHMVGKRKSGVLRGYEPSAALLQTQEPEQTAATSRGSPPEGRMGVCWRARLGRHGWGHTWPAHTADVPPCRMFFLQPALPAWCLFLKVSLLLNGLDVSGAEAEISTWK